jgi:hypothetical protein
VKNLRASYKILTRVIHFKFMREIVLNWTLRAFEDFDINVRLLLPESFYVYSKQRNQAVKIIIYVDNFLTIASVSNNRFSTSLFSNVYVFFSKNRGLRAKKSYFFFTKIVLIALISADHPKTTDSAFVLK